MLIDFLCDRFKLRIALRGLFRLFYPSRSSTVMLNDYSPILTQCVTLFVAHTHERYTQCLCARIYPTRTHARVRAQVRTTRPRYLHAGKESTFISGFDSTKLKGGNDDGPQKLRHNETRAHET